ncbi:4'-phosphopantetheinyl transferase family protein [Streptococcus jiangjianxini]|uniref:4'-phosphopantetheinyl transferase family protein n=1 Tax=Streptococcus jiangjianxini TaxID=3161189 RepID=UPI0032EC035F
MIKVYFYRYDNIKNYNVLMNFTKFSSISRYNYSKSYFHKENTFNSALAYTILCMSIGKYRLEILRGKNGKPYIEGSNLFVSISHTVGLVAIAISDNFDIGIDCEKLDNIDDEVKNITYSNSEIEITKNCPIKSTLFWTAKEALSKLKNEDWYSTKRTELYMIDNTIKETNNRDIIFDYKLISKGIICLASSRLNKDKIFIEVTDDDLVNFCLSSMSNNKV